MKTIVMHSPHPLEFDMDDCSICYGAAITPGETVTMTLMVWDFENEEGQALLEALKGKHIKVTVEIL